MSGREPSSVGRGPGEAYDARDRRATIDAVFDEALDVPKDRRADWLAARCADDDALRREVELLLAAHEHEDSVLDRPAAGRVAALLAERTAGRRSGPYRVLREL